jgi:hypothetical protein
MKDENDENFETVGPGKDFPCENSRPDIATRTGLPRAVPDSYSCCREFNASVAVAAPGTHPPAAKTFFLLRSANI